MKPLKRILIHDVTGAPIHLREDGTSTEHKETRIVEKFRITSKKQHLSQQSSNGIGKDVDLHILGKKRMKSLLHFCSQLFHIMHRFTSAGIKTKRIDINARAERDIGEGGIVCLAVFCLSAFGPRQCQMRIDPSFRRTVHVKCNREKDDRFLCIDSKIFRPRKIFFPGTFV